MGYQKKELEINSFFKGLSESEHKDSNKVYEILFEGLKNRNDQFEFYNIIIAKNSTRHGKINFGKLLKNKYSNSDLTNSEKLVIERLEEIIIEFENDRKEKKLKSKKINLDIEQNNLEIEKMLKNMKSKRDKK